MVKVLDPSLAGTIADAVIAELEYDGGYSVEEMIPGLAQAIIQLTMDHPYSEQVLDEVANMIADAEI